jgi:Ser/Thr protein kinase RdoA (MazF antagonist)
VDAVVRGYGKTVALEPAEIEHLGDAMALRPAVLACWTCATGRSTAEDSAAWWADQQRSLLSAAARARAAISESQ